MIHRITRRSFLAQAAMGSALCVTGVGAAPEDRPYGPFRMGIQSYSLRGSNLDTALEETMDLGLDYWEAFPDHIHTDLNPAYISDMLDRLDIAGVRLWSYGVVGFGNDKDQNRRTFEFARAMGIRVISADPEPESFDQLDQLVDEFRIKIAIHNHGPGSRYSSLEDVTNALKGRHLRIGACVDTGHFMRSKVDPVKAVETIGRRVFDVHLKDVKGNDRFAILGQGDMDLVGLLKALQRLRFREAMSLEYEEHPEDPMPDVRACLAALREAVKKI